MGRMARFRRSVRSVSDTPILDHDVADPDSALPSVGARVVAFTSILLGGALGAIIGSSFINLQCTGDCSVPSGLGMFVGSIVGSIGIAIVAMLTLRAFGEWNTLQQRSSRT